ncbi:hypothetical protein F5878DRAFT_603821 [Lentinula raphanica]|uniref:Uncharacterized protein n=1 Tax=Lentinula raphanica TaxID=153919 RepID=A0AA38PIX9_9AGAR|nr:hypothetical protein F5878DRAFT_603821 [Lentinula raphanica]
MVKPVLWPLLGTLLTVKLLKVFLVVLLLLHRPTVEFRLRLLLLLLFLKITGTRIIEAESSTLKLLETTSPLVTLL